MRSLCNTENIIIRNDLWNTDACCRIRLITRNSVVLIIISHRPHSWVITKRLWACPKPSGCCYVKKRLCLWIIWKNPMYSWKLMEIKMFDNANQPLQSAPNLLIWNENCNKPIKKINRKLIKGILLAATRQLVTQQKLHKKINTHYIVWHVVARISTRPHLRWTAFQSP